MCDSNTRGRLSTMDMLLLLVVIIWGLNYVIVKVSLKEMEPLQFNTLRFTIGAVVCWIILLFKEKNIKITKKQLFHLVFIGAVVHSINQIAFIYGLAKTTAGTASIILASTPMCVALLASIFKIEKAGIETWMGIIISFTGVMLAVMGSGNALSLGAESILGNLLIVIAMIFWSLYSISMQMFFKDISTIKVTTYSMTFAALVFLIMTFKQVWQCNWSAFSSEAWGGVLFSGVFVFGISYMLWNMGIQKAGPTKTSIYANIPPFISILAGWTLLGETISMIQIIGGALIFIGLAYAGKSNKKPKSIED